MRWKWMPTRLKDTAETVNHWPALMPLRNWNHKHGSERNEDSDAAGDQDVIERSRKPCVVFEADVSRVQQILQLVGVRHRFVHLDVSSPDFVCVAPEALCTWRWGKHWSGADDC